MEPKKVTVYVRMKAKVGMEVPLWKELLSLVEPSRSDEGCINYDLHQVLGDPSVFIFYENWASKDLLDKHLATNHLQAFLAKAGSLLAEPPEIVLLEMIS